MNWWRAHHGISHDPKLALVAKKAKVKKCEALAVWISILDYASQQPERGTVAGIDYEEISFQTDIPLDTVHRIVSQFRDKEMLAGVRLVAWGKRQYGDSSTERVKRHRENKVLSLKCNGVKRDETNETRDETPVTVETLRADTEQIQNRAEQQQPKGSLIEFPKSAEFIEASFPGTGDRLVREIAHRAVQEVISAGKQPELVTDEVLLRALRECTRKKQYSAALYRETVPAWMKYMATHE